MSEACGRPPMTRTAGLETSLSRQADELSTVGVLTTTVDDTPCTSPFHFHSRNAFSNEDFDAIKE